MEQNTIIQNNKLIAEFMELPCPPKYADPETSECGYGYYHASELDYHDSWDWLMPVVEKIESLDFEVMIYHSCCDISAPDPHQRDAYVHTVAATCHPEAKGKLQAVYLSVGKFIEWHNKRKSIEADTPQRSEE